MKVLVTGTDGYIGTILAPRLHEDGHEVVGLDAGFFCEGSLYPNGPSFTRIRKDVRRITDADLAGFDAVVHLAELSNDPLGQLNPGLTFQINHQGSVALARQAKAAGVRRFVHSSSCSVYGAGNDDVKTEASDVNPQTAYAHCKVLVERDVSALADDNFSPTFLRNATAFGPSPHMRFDIVLNNLAGLAWTTGQIRMTSDGSPWRPLVHIRDIAEAVACVLQAPREAVHNEVFNVGSNSANYRVREIAEVIAEIFPGCELTFGRNDGDTRSYRVCFDKIHQQLPGFRCQFDARSGAQQLREIFEQINLDDEAFKFRTFTRLSQINYLRETQQLDENLFWRSSNDAPRLESNYAIH